jgi:hypothetical protein
MTNIITDLITHYRTACIKAIVKKDVQSTEKYLSILQLLHRPTYIAIKNIQNKKSK